MGFRRGALISKEDKIQALDLISEACENGANQKTSCNILGISPRTIQRWKRSRDLKDKRINRKNKPHNKLSIEEQE